MVTLGAWLAGCVASGASATAGDVRRDMDTHFEAVGHARDALLRGDLSTVHTDASEVMARIPVDGMPARLREREADLQRALRRLAGSPDLYAAGEALGGVAAACASCHQQAGLKAPAQALSASPPSSDPLRGEMQRHGEASARMWTGLVLGDDAAWRQGVSAFQQGSLVPSGDASTSALPPQVAELEVSVHDLAAKAAAAPDATSCATAYGELLATCASCHQLLDRGPSAPTP